MSASSTAKPSLRDVDLERIADDERLSRLQNEARERRWANVRPADAATLIILDRTGKLPKVLMGRRHPDHKFMPNKFVFPGGRVDASDRKMPVAGLLDETMEEKLHRQVARPSASRPRALALAAIRETFEETGLLIGSRDYGAPDAPEGTPWADFAKHGVFPALDGLHFIARAITPPKRPKRFDARFFVVDSSAIAHRVEGMVGPQSELIDLAWVSFDETRDMELPAITRVVIEEVAESLEHGLSPRRPVPFYYERNRLFRRDYL